MKNPDRSWLAAWDGMFGLYVGWCVLPNGDRVLYVGGTAKPKVFRWNEHLDGYNHSRFVRRYGTTLARIAYPKKYKVRYETRDEMELMEESLANWFRRKGYKVRQG